MSARQDGGVANGTGRYDAVVVGASLAGCATAMFLGRAGLRVALLEKSPDPGAFKRICSHYIQASGVPTLERLGLLEPILAAGAVRSRNLVRTRWGWIEPPAERASLAVNLRRERLDPLVREAAAATPGVELMLGRRAVRPSWREGAVAGVIARGLDGGEEPILASLVVGADGRDAPFARSAGVATRTSPHNRFAYASYFEGPQPSWAPDSAIWFQEPQCAAAFPTDGGLTMYVAIMTKDRLPGSGATRWPSSSPSSRPSRTRRRSAPPARWGRCSASST